MFKKMMVCLDGSELAESVLPYAAAQALRFNSEVVLFRAVPPPAPITPAAPMAAPAPAEAGLLPVGMEHAEAAARKYLEKVGKSLRAKGLSVKEAVTTGPAPQALAEYAAAENVDLVALSTHGHSGLVRAIMGSVTDLALRELGLPTLALRPRDGEQARPAGFQPSFKEILVCLDGSPLAAQVLPYATEEALRFDAKVRLVRVLTVPAAVTAAAGPDKPVMSGELLEESLRGEEAGARAYLDEAAQPLLEKGIDVECVVLQPSATGSAIVEFARARSADLICMATHGRTGLGRVVLGSVTDQVLRESGLPLFMVKPRETGKGGGDRR
ncbi:MAG: universal stress protein [Elusimicrobiales bacterium]|nr:universal stress protein [Elusimicrobiales bacterium]